MHNKKTMRTAATMFIGALAGLSMLCGTAGAAGPWTVSLAQPDTWRFTAVAWGQGRYTAATSDGIIAISTDGASWRPVAADSGWRIRKIAFGPGGWVAAGWYWVADGYTPGLILKSPDGIRWSEALRSDQLDDPVAIDASGGVWRIFCGDSVWRSTDGAHWTRNAFVFDGSAITVDAVVRWHGGWVAAGTAGHGSHDSSGWIGTSSGGVTWRTLATPEHAFSCLTASPARLVAGGDGIVAWSDDGASWIVGDVPNGAGVHLTDLLWTGNRFVAIGAQPRAGSSEGSGVILISADGTAWTYATVDPFEDRIGLPIGELHALARSQPGMIAAGDQTVMVSGDGERWEHRVFGFPTQMDQLVPFGTTLLAIQTELPPGQDPSNVSHEALLSQDGIDWLEPGAPTIEPTGSAWRFIAHGELLFGFERYTGRSVAVRTSDGQWQTASLPAASGSFPAAAAWGTPGIVVVETNGLIDFSTGGLTWTARTIPGLHVFWQNVVWTGSMFLAIGSQGETAVSFNGLEWAVRQGAGNALDASHVATNGEVTVAVGRFGSLAWTVDGRQWTFVATGISRDFNAVRWTGNRFVAVGDNGIVLESSDGRVWSAGEKPSLAVNLRGVADAGGRTVAVGDGPTIQVHLPSVPDAAGPVAYRTVIPAAAHSPGANGSFWNTNVTLSSRSGRPVLAWLRWIRQSAPPVVRPFVVSGHLVLDDVVATLFGADSGSGALIVDSDAALAATSRTAAQAAGQGPGQVLPGIPPLSGAAPAVLPGLRGGPSFRTNIGLANVSAAGEHVTVELYDGSGVRIRTREIDLDAWRSVQLNRVLKGRAATGAVWARVTADGPFSAYASVIDNGTNDAATVLPATVTSDPLVIPAAAHTPGYNGALWRTSLDLVNPGDAPAEAALELLTPEGGTIPGGSVELGPGTAVRIDDVLAARFPGHTAGAIRITPSSGTIAAWSRTFDLTASGTLGQGIPAVPGKDASMPAGGSLMLAGLSGGPAASGWFHTNLGLVNTGDAPAKLRVTIGVETAVAFDRFVTVPANGWMQLLKVFRDVTVGPVAGGWIKVAVTGGSDRVLAWASVIDDGSGDPSFLTAWQVPAAPDE